MLIRKILISPSCFFFCLEEELLSIRELQNKNENYNDFLIARFVDEDFTSVANNKILIWGIFEDFANNGLNLLDCKYDFVGFNVKMLEKESFLLVNRGERLSAERISETLLGKISIFNEKIVNNPKAPLHYRNLPYYCYRMNNCLGQGLKLEEVLFQNRDNGMIMSSEYKEKDNIILELAVDMQFYDGFISKDLLEEIAFALREEMISLIEVNFFGYSMLLVLNESLRTRRIRVKKEIYEKVFNEIYSCKEIIEKNEIEQPELIFIEDNGIFFDQYQNLKIEKILLLDFARKRPVPLNHSSLAILKALEEKNKLDVVNSDLSNLMIKYQSNLFLKMKSDLFSPFPETIASLSHKGDLRNKIKPADFTCYQQFNRLSFFEKCRLENISFPYDIFFRMLIDNYSYRLLKDIRDKASYCPFEHFNSFYAIPDPENQLVKQEAFLQISIDGKKEILIGDLLIFREFSIDPYEVRVLHAKEKNTLSSYVNVLIVSREFFLELDKYMKTPYIYSNRFLVLKDQRMKFEEVQKDQGFLNKIAAVYDLAMQRFNETDSDFCIRLPNVKNYFLDQISNKMAWDYKIQHLIFLKEQTSKLFKETKFGKFMVPYIKAIFSCYLCQFETNENTLNEVYPDFLKERVKKGKEKMIFERSLNLEGTLYGDALNESLKFDKQSAWEKGFVYDFSQAYYDEQFFHELDDKKSIEYIIEVSFNLYIFLVKYLILL